MYPEILSFKWVTLHTYGFFVAAGIIAGFQVSLKNARYRSLPAEYINQIFTGIVVCGLAGARAAYVILSFNEYIHTPLRILMFWEGGLVFAGSFIGSALWILYSSHRSGYELWSVVDVLAPGIALGHAVGRIGCFFAGCCYGKPTDLFTGIKFSDPRSLAYPLDVPLHPTQIYSSVFMFILSAVLYLKLKDGKTPNSGVFSLYLTAYGIFRVLIEFLRGDYRGTTLTGLTMTQWLALLCIAAGIYLMKKGVRTGKNG
ncbi:MAG: prolipoprotein diacylglyceryl transferase [Elusimicrobiota bacterium]